MEQDPGVVASEPAAEDLVVGEPRWHMASAVIAAVVLALLMPDDLRLGPNWLLPVIVGVLLVAQIVGDPGRIDRRTAQLRALSVGLICVLVLSAVWATVLLTSHLINGGRRLNQPAHCWKRARSSGGQTSSPSPFSIGSWTVAGRRSGLTGRLPEESTSPSRSR